MQGTRAAKYKNTLDCFKQIMLQDGVGGFYKGLIPRMGRVVPGQVSVFQKESICHKYCHCYYVISS